MNNKFKFDGQQELSRKELKEIKGGAYQSCSTDHDCTMHGSKCLQGKCAEIMGFGAYGVEDQASGTLICGLSSSLADSYSKNFPEAKCRIGNGCKICTQESIGH